MIYIEPNILSKKLVFVKVESGSGICHKCSKCIVMNEALVNKLNKSGADITYSDCSNYGCMQFSLKAGYSYWLWYSSLFMISYVKNNKSNNI